MKNAKAANTKTATKAVAPVKTATNKKVVIVSPIAPKADKGTPASKKEELVTICKTKYGYWRYWVKDILVNAGVLKYRFIKNKDNYDGVIAVSSKEVEKAKAALDKYKKDNPNTVEMWS